jgi:hypothetical protein
MYAKKIMYTDYNGSKREETFHFNLTAAELLEMELMEDGGMESLLQRIVETRNYKQLVTIFKQMILGAYGVKSPDGKRFIKSKELTDEFQQTEAFAELYIELATNDEAATAFVNATLPSKERMEEVRRRIDAGQPKVVESV